MCSMRLNLETAFTAAQIPGDRRPHCRVRYDLEEISRPDLSDVIAIFLLTHAQPRQLKF